MSVNPKSANTALYGDLLFDPLTLTPFVRLRKQGAVQGKRPAGEALQLLTAQAQVMDFASADVRPLTPEEAQERLERLLAQPEMQQHFMQELGRAGSQNALLDPLAGLLGATSAEEFTDALMAWTSEKQPEKLEQHLDALTQNMNEAVSRLQAGQLPGSFTDGPPAGPVQEVSPLLLGFIALSKAAQTEAAQIKAAQSDLVEGAEEAPTLPAEVPSRLTLPAVQLDFSTTNLERVLGRKMTVDSDVDSGADPPATDPPMTTQPATGDP